MSTVAAHALLTLLLWLVAAPVGGATGYALARGIRRLAERWPSLPDLMALGPWRTLAVLLPLPLPYVLLAVHSQWAHVLTLAQSYLAMFGASLTACLVIWSMAIAASTALSHWSPPALAVRLAGLARTLAVVGLAVVVPLGEFGMGGAGFVMYQDLMLMKWGEALRIYLWVAVLALVVDVALGVVQQAIARMSGRPRVGGAPI